jgi:nitrate/TMAO reductase-like tetraheme cytochrome c subunit
MAETKTCNVCEISKNVIDFYHNNKTSDNLSNICKTCYCLKQNIWRTKNLVKIKQQKKNWYQKNKIKVLQQRKKNEERIKLLSKKWRINHPESNKIWRKHNIEKVKIYPK